MYEPHESLECPPDEARVWRYMDIGKFVAILSTRSLHFCRLDLLRDPYEGLPNQLTRDAWKNVEARPGEMDRLYSLNRRWTYANNWHLNEFESAAMWELYLKTFEGVAIETTVGRLKRSFDAEPDHKVFISRVIYIDYETAPVPWDNGFFPAIHKRKSFEHEQELRALIWWALVKNVDLNAPPPDGIDARVDIPRLVRSVFISPSAGSWYVDVVRSLLDKFGYATIPVKQSQLYTLK